MKLSILILILSSSLLGAYAFSTTFNVQPVNWWQWGMVGFFFIFSLMDLLDKDKRLKK